MINVNNGENTELFAAKQRRKQRKITPARLRNIALYYLQRFETSAANLRSVLKRRIEAYARENPEWNKQEAEQWIEDILSEFEHYHYVDDNRYAEIKINSYLNAGKPERYIKIKLQQKGVSESKIDAILQNKEYNPKEMALKLAKRKKIGPYRDQEQRREFRQKDMGTLIRAGFDYDIVCEVLDFNPEDSQIQ